MNKKSRYFKKKRKSTKKRHSPLTLIASTNIASNSGCSSTTGSFIFIAFNKIEFAVFSLKPCETLLFFKWCGVSLEKEKKIQKKINFQKKTKKYKKFNLLSLQFWQFLCLFIHFCFQFFIKFFFNLFFKTNSSL